MININIINFKILLLKKKEYLCNIFKLVAFLEASTNPRSCDGRVYVFQRKKPSQIPGLGIIFIFGNFNQVKNIKFKIIL